MITKEFLEEQIIKLSNERDKAKLDVAKTRIELDGAKKAHKEALDTLDCCDVLLTEFYFQLGVMEEKCAKQIVTAPSAAT